MLSFLTLACSSYSPHSIRRKHEEDRFLYNQQSTSAYTTSAFYPPEMYFFK